MRLNKNSLHHAESTFGQTIELPGYDSVSFCFTGASQVSTKFRMQATLNRLVDSGTICTLLIYNNGFSSLEETGRAMAAWSRPSMRSIELSFVVSSIPGAEAVVPLAAAPFVCLHKDIVTWSGDRSIQSRCMSK